MIEDLVRDTVSRGVYREVTGQKPEDIDTDGEVIVRRKRGEPADPDSDTP